MVFPSSRYVQHHCDVVLMPLRVTNGMGQIQLGK